MHQHPPTWVDARRGSLPAFELLYGIGDLLKPDLVEDCPLATNPVRVQHQDPIQSDVAWAPLRVPRTRSQIHPHSRPLATDRLGWSMVLTRHHEAQDIAPMAGNDEHWTILALAWIVFVWHPGPHDFARIRVTVWVRLVGNGGLAGEVTAPTASDDAILSSATASLRAARPRRTVMCFAIAFLGGPRTA